MLSLGYECFIGDFNFIEVFFSGLSAARLLRKQDLSVVVCEAQERVGGRTHTTRVSVLGA